MDLSHLFAKGVKGAVVVPGSKASQTSEAFITSLKSANKFVLSRPAMQKLGIIPGSQVMMIDLARIHSADMLNENNRFYIAVISREGENNISAGAKVGKNGAFSYSIMQGAMLANDGRVEVSNEDLVKMNLGKMVPAYTFVDVKDEQGNIVMEDGKPVQVSLENGVRFSADYTIRYDLEATGQRQVLVEGEDPVELFVLTERKVEEATSTKKVIGPRKRKIVDQNGSEIEAPEVDGEDGEDGEDADYTETVDTSVEEDNNDEDYQ